MTSVHCPSCREEVTIPAHAQAQALVQCPLCQDEFPLSAALAELPPELIVVQRVAPAGADDSQDATERRRPDTSPHSPQTHGLPDPAGAPGETAAPAFHFDTHSVRPRRPASLADGARRRRASSPWRHMVQIVLGGAAGILLAQLMLWWIPVNLSPANRDVTGIGRKYGHYVPFLVPSSVRAAATGGYELAGEGQTADGARSDLPDTAPRSAPTTGFPIAQGQLAGHDAEPPQSSDAVSDPPASPPRDETAASDVGAERPAVSRPPAEGPAGPAGPTAPPEPAQAVARSLAAETDASSDLPAGELQRRWDEAVAAEQALQVDATTDRAAQRQRAADFYRAFAGLGEALAVADPGDPQVAERLEEARRLLARISRQEQTRRVVAAGTPSWLDSPRPHRGVFLYGHVRHSQVRQSVRETDVELASQDRRVVTVLGPPADGDAWVAGTPLLVLGALVETPPDATGGENHGAQLTVRDGSHYSWSALPAAP